MSTAILAADPISPSSALFMLADIATPEAELTPAWPLGLLLAVPSTSTPVDLSGVVYDPQRQVALGTDGLPFAATKYSVNTPYTTVYDHSRFSDNQPDTRND